MGQLVTDANVHIGHQITVNAGFDQALEAALRGADEKDRANPQIIEPSVIDDHCEPWTNHMNMALGAVPAGKFLMGASSGDSDADPEGERTREVSLTSSFWMGKVPVTRGQYRAVMGGVPDTPFESHAGDEKPVTQISWRDAMAFCTRLTELERDENALPSGFTYRLPTEAEWEYACRAGSTKSRHGMLEEIALVAETGHRFEKAGGRMPNAWGLHDMLGLVYEWCHDVYAPYRPLKTVNPVNERPETASLNQPLVRVVRGGSYQDAAAFARASARLGHPETKHSGRVGFRVVLARPLSSEAERIGP
jgi:formylglycine-generating enzyme required for sulfatase activity